MVVLYLGATALGFYARYNSVDVVVVVGALVLLLLNYSIYKAREYKNG